MLRHLPFFMLLTAFCGAEDVIILDNHQRISGTIVAEVQADDRLVSICTGSGILRFDLKRIERIELSYATRKSQVKDQDPQGLTDLARWCQSQGMANEALELLDKAAVLPGAEAQTQVLYLRMVDEVRGPETALPLYKAWRDAGGSDPDTTQRLMQLEKVKADYEAQFGPVETGAIVKRPDFSREGLETRAWMPESPQYFNPAEIERVTLAGVGSESSNAALKITCKKDGNQDKAAVRLSMAAAAGNQSLFGFSVANMSKRALNVGLAIKTGSRYIYFESEPILVEATGKFTPITFNLKTTTWKSEASNWRSNVAIAELEQIREVQILFHNGRNDVVVMIDQVAFQGIKDL